MVDKPVPGKVYSLTGKKGTKCIANGNTWAESEYKEEENGVWSEFAEEGLFKDARDHHQIMKKGIVR